MLLRLRQLRPSASFEGLTGLLESVFSHAISNLSHSEALHHKAARLSRVKFDNRHHQRIAMYLRWGMRGYGLFMLSVWLLAMRHVAPVASEPETQSGPITTDMRDSTSHRLRRRLPNTPTVQLTGCDMMTYRFWCSAYYSVSKQGATACLMNGSLILHRACPRQRTDSKGHPAADR